MKILTLHCEGLNSGAYLPKLERQTSPIFRPVRLELRLPTVWNLKPKHLFLPDIKQGSEQQFHSDTMKHFLHPYNRVERCLGNSKLCRLTYLCVYVGIYLTKRHLRPMPRARRANFGRHMHIDKLSTSANFHLNGQRLHFQGQPFESSTL